MSPEVENKNTVKTNTNNLMISRAEVIKAIEKYPLFEYQTTDLLNSICGLDSSGVSTNKVILATLEGLNINFQNLKGLEKRQLEDSLRDFGITNFNLNELFRN